MSAQWKPGDVAMVTGPARLAREWSAGRPAEGNTTTLCHRVHSADGYGFWRIVGQERFGFLDREVIDARPLVVIDPEAILPGWSADLLPSLLEASAEIVAESAAPREVQETTFLLNLAKAFDAALGGLRKWDDLDVIRVVSDGGVQP